MVLVCPLCFLLLYHWAASPRCESWVLEVLLFPSRGMLMEWDSSLYRPPMSGPFLPLGESLTLCIQLRSSLSPLGGCGSLGTAFCFS